MFLVVLQRSGPHWDPSRPLEEQAGWATHASFMDALVDAGFIVLGGPLADEHRVVLVVETESEDAVRAALARDPWSETISGSIRSTHGRSGSTDGAPSRGSREAGPPGAFASAGADPGRFSCPRACSNVPRSLVVRMAPDS